ncbi:Holliday junction resolvase RecU [Paenibacillus rhizophilus]|uniref:Holliday junction resolvase RecU n=1 Tax=Paenibacillus rhizophilus TaxID=1850366 RepID=A0A3N9P167_9BACL|nr:Holliday junction resolvase RecU [Paenibacillus rhizophilus]RQW09941.1 Holliday junction resolvase RecU [Paenibacillus rhizophilus]
MGERAKSKASNYGNRGMAFEGFLEYSNELYSKRDIAIIKKRPTPIKVIQMRGGRITDAVFEKKSSVDFDGIYRSRRLDFEAKDVEDLVRFDLSRVEDHQYEHLERSHRHGSLTFILVHFGRNRVTYLLPFTALRKYKRAAAGGGRKSISLDDFEIEGYEVRSGRVPVDYLAVVDKLWFSAET